MMAILFCVIPCSPSEWFGSLCLSFQQANRIVKVCRIQFYADEFSFHSDGNHADSTAPKKWIEDEIVNLC